MNATLLRSGDSAGRGAQPRGQAQGGAGPGTLWWLRALTLEERAATSRRARGGATGPGVDRELAGRRARRWRSQPPFPDEGLFQRRLDAGRISEPEFLRLLGEPAEALHGLVPGVPAWLTDYAQAFDSAGLPAEGDDAPDGDGGEAGGPPGFAAAVAPFVGLALLRLRAGIGALGPARADSPFDPDRMPDALLQGLDLAGQLTDKLLRTLVLELNVARLSGRLQGDTAEERFRGFIRRMGRREGATELFQEYPVLARQLVACTTNWVNFGLEFLRHLGADWDAIVTAFPPGRGPGRLEHIDGGAGDTHRGGRSVMIATFSSGLKLVYKPRSLRIDVHWAELLTWVNARGGHPPFRVLTTLDRGDHGWVEFVDAAGCTCEDEVARFYERQGGYLALLYAVEAVDFHYENLIAAGEHPVLIDLEALFHPRDPGDHRARTPAEAALGHSVMNVGLLPQRIFATADGEGIDLSGLGGAPGQAAPDGALGVRSPGTDEMRVGFEPVSFPGSRNRPGLRGEEVDVRDYADAVARGFTAVYRLLVGCRDELLAADGPLARCDADEVRVVLRPTRTYALLLRDGFHPDVLRDALDRDLLFDRLWAQVAQRPSLARAIAAECADLHGGDVPLFRSRPGSRDLVTSTGESIPDFFDEPSIDSVRRRIRGLREDDLARQLWIIRASLASLATAGEGRTRYRLLDEMPPPAGRERLLACAQAVGDRLAATALDEGDRTSWLGVTFLDQRSWAPTPLGPDLYDGLGGIALFFAYLGHLTQDERHTAQARAAVTSLLRQCDAASGASSQDFGIGAFTGWGGVIYTLMHLGTLWDDHPLLARAEALVELLPPLIETDDALDIIGGAAGAICVLSGLYRLTSSRRALEVAIRCGERLIGRAPALVGGPGRRALLEGERPLTGFSHGAAGMACALLDLAALTGQPRFGQAAADALAYERSQFSPAHGNWPDHRLVSGPDGEGPGYMVSWCHGASGIGLARLRSLAYLDDEQTRTEIHTALRTTLEEGFGSNHCLCHGDLGNLELLLEAGKAMDAPSWRDQAERRAGAVLEGIRRDGWLCGTPLQVETPGFMTGLAGIGYGLLRLAEPGQVPSILSLAPPITGQAGTPCAATGPRP